MAPKIHFIDVENESSKTSCLLVDFLLHIQPFSNHITPLDAWYSSCRVSGGHPDTMQKELATQVSQGGFSHLELEMCLLNGE